MTTAIESPPFADARFEGPKFTGDAGSRAIIEFMSGFYTAFFDQEFQPGDLLRSYDGIHYHRMDVISESYCCVAEVKQDELCKIRPECDQKGRPWGEVFPYRTLLKMIKHSDPVFMKDFIKARELAGLSTT